MGRFKKATKKRRKAKVALVGPSGSGKTFTALLLARRLRELDAEEAGVPVDGTELPLVIDTEHGSAEDYADLFDFDTAPVKPPFDPDRLVAALALAAEDGYGVVIIDSLTHFWAGDGGTREIVDASGTGKFSGWKVGTPKWNRMVNAILGYPGHVLVCSRARTEYVVAPDGKPTKVGVGPDARPGTEYEFQVVLDLDQTHTATVSKSRLGDALPVASAVAMPGPELADALYAWLRSGVEAEPPASEPPTPTPSAADADQQALPAASAPEPAPAAASSPEPTPAPAAASTPEGLAGIVARVAESFGLNERDAGITALVARGDLTTAAVAVETGVSSAVVRNVKSKAQKVGALTAAEQLWAVHRLAAAPTPSTPVSAPETPPAGDPPSESSEAASGAESAPSVGEEWAGWTEEQRQRLADLAATLDELRVVDGGWRHVIADRIQTELGKPLAALSTEEAAALLERLETTRLRLREQQPAA